jgi:DNA mismatch repair protein MutS
VSRDDRPVSRRAAAVELEPAAGELRSVLFGQQPAEPVAFQPACFRDLNLDQLVDAVVAGRDEYDLRPFFHTPLQEPGAVAYRHEVFHDLERPRVRQAVVEFSDALRRVRQFLKLIETQRYAYERERWQLDAAIVYHEAVTALAARLVELEPGSCALRRLQALLGGYVASDDFTGLVAETREVTDGLDRVRYTVRIDGARVTVSPFRGESDYSAEVEGTFARFRQGEVEDHLVRLGDPGAMDHVEARIAELVARLYPEEFAALDDFSARRREFVQPLLASFEREVQFYLAWLEHAERLREVGVEFCYPQVSDRSKQAKVAGAVDLALATKLLDEGASPVPNDVVLEGEEHVAVVTGPNNGGKTTFARMAGQLHYLAALGVPVGAKSAQLFLADRVFTHFERQEEVSSLHGKLDDELLRVKEILEQASGDSLIVLNELFASATLADSVFLGGEVLARIAELGCLAVWVTFVDELASPSPATASVVATVEPDDPSRRTFRLVRRPADGRAYAWALAAKYGLSPERLAERLAR